MRFSLEAFEDALPAMRPIARELHALQDGIGQLHDHEVALELIMRWCRKSKLEMTPALERYVVHRKRAKDRLRAQAEPRWLSVLGAGFRRRIARALEKEGSAH